MNDNFWHGSRQPGNDSNGCILYGVIGEENPKHPGIYRFSSTDGLVLNDAILMTPDADLEGGGAFSKPRAGAMCLAVMPRNGSQAFIVNFQDPVRFDEDGAGEEPAVAVPDDLASGGDKVWATSGGAKLMLRRGGLAIIEGGPGASILLGPTNNQITLRSSNVAHIANGYRATRGRKEPGKTAPETVHEETFDNKVGAAYDRVRFRHGELENSARRELTITEVVSAAGQTTTVTKTRETYYNDGSWVGEGPKYQWGGTGASEPIVLGNALIAVIKKLSSIIKGIKVPTAWGPSGTPLPPTPTDLLDLERNLDDILSEFMFVTKKPAEFG